MRKEDITLNEKRVSLCNFLFYNFSIKKCLCYSYAILKTYLNDPLWPFVTGLGLVAIEEEPFSHAASSSFIACVAA